MILFDKLPSSTRTFGLRIIGPNNGYEIYGICSSGKMPLRSPEDVDKTFGYGSNLWCEEHLRSLISVIDCLDVYQYSVGPTANTTIIKHLLTTRSDWSRK